MTLLFQARYSADLLTLTGIAIGRLITLFWGTAIPGEAPQLHTKKCQVEEQRVGRTYNARQIRNDATFDDPRLLQQCKLVQQSCKPPTRLPRLLFSKALVNVHSNHFLPSFRRKHRNVTTLLTTEHEKLIRHTLFCSLHPDITNIKKLGRTRKAQHFPCCKSAWPESPLNKEAPHLKHLSTQLIPACRTWSPSATFVMFLSQYHPLKDIISHRKHAVCSTLLTQVSR